MSEETSTSTTTTETTESENQQPTPIKDFFIGTTIEGFIARGTLIPVVIYLLIFIIGFAMAWFYPQGSAGRFDYIRSLFEIIVSISIILIFIAVGVLILQIARFVNLLRSEVKPITRDTKQAIKNVRVTTEFVQKNAIKPVIETNTFIAGLIAFLREIARVSRLFQRRNKETEETSDEQATQNPST